jgi:UDP-glucose 4-epimerase
VENGVSGTGQRVFVTGASGFLGRTLVKALLDTGHQVTAMARTSPLPASLRCPALTELSGDLRRIDDMRSAIAECDAILHLGAHIPASFDDPDEARACVDVNGLATLQLARMVRRHSGQRFIYFSAHAYCDAPVPVSENDPMYPVEKATYYLASKLLGEIYIEHLRRLEDLGSITLRVSSCYGPGLPHTTVLGRFMSRAAKGEPLEVYDGGKATYDLVYDLDVVGLALQALVAGQPGVYNVGSGTRVTVAEVATAVADCYKDSGIEIKSVETAASVIPSGFPALDIGKACSEWSFDPRPLTSGLVGYRRRLEGRSE